MSNYKKGTYVCQDCGKDCGNPPALNLHKAYCKGEKQPKAVNSKCDHEFRLLRPAIAAEHKALLDGYLQVCTKCNELE